MSAEPTTGPLLVRDGDGEALWFLGNLVTLKVTADRTTDRISLMEFLNPAGFAPPLHRHRTEDEVFYLLDGEARFFCGDEVLDAGPGDTVLLPRGIPHTFLVGPDAPMRTLQITAPGGFEGFAREAGEPAAARELPAPGPLDPAELARIADTYGHDILGPPPGH